MSQIRNPPPVKVTLLGESGAGKSSIVLQQTKGSFQPNQACFNFLRTVSLWAGLRSSGVAQTSYECAGDNHWSCLCNLHSSCSKCQAWNMVCSSIVGGLDTRFCLRGFPLVALWLGHVWIASRSHHQPKAHASVLCFRDTAGQERYASLAPMYYRYVIVVSFATLQGVHSAFTKWLEQYIFILQECIGCYNRLRCHKCGFI